MSVEEKKAIIRRVLDELYNKKNLAVIDELATTDVVAHTTTVDLNGWQGWKQYANMFLTAFPNLQLTIEDLIAEGDKVVARWSARGTHTGPLRSIQPTGKEIKVTGVAIYRFVDKKIAEGWALNDTLGMMQQLGVVPSLG